VRDVEHGSVSINQRTDLDVFPLDVSLTKHLLLSMLGRIVSIYLRLRLGKTRMLDQWWIILSNCLPNRAILLLSKLCPHMFGVTVLKDGVEVPVRFLGVYQDVDTSIPDTGIIRTHTTTGTDWALAEYRTTALRSPPRWRLAWHRLTLDYPLLTRSLPPNPPGRHYHLILREGAEEHHRLFHYRDGRVTQYHTLTHTWNEIPFGAIDLRPDTPPEPAMSDDELQAMIGGIEG
jgi:hypothetical protein